MAITGDFPKAASGHGRRGRHMTMSCSGNRGGHARHLSKGARREGTF